MNARRSRLTRPRCAVLLVAGALAPLATSSATAGAPPADDPVERAAAYVGVPAVALRQDIVLEARRTGRLGLQVVLDRLAAERDARLGTAASAGELSPERASAVITAHDEIRIALLGEAARPIGALSWSMQLPATR